jgi:4'-phosphopantetheinyl transferase
VIADGSCLVWWAGLADHRAAHESLLSAVEVERAGRLRRAEDRVRQMLGAVLLRLAVSAATGTAPAGVAVDRTCPRCGQPHGRPTLPGTDLHASITHSGDLVGLALTRIGPVGLDVEWITDIDVDGLARTVLHPDEHAADLAGFFTYWTRKEAVVKATGDGLGVPLPEVRVASPAEPPELLAYPGRTPDATLHDLHPAPGYRAALAVLTTAPVRPVEQRGDLGRLLMCTRE